MTESGNELRKNMETEGASKNARKGKDKATSSKELTLQELAERAEKGLDKDGTDPVVEGTKKKKKKRKSVLVETPEVPENAVSGGKDPTKEKETPAMRNGAGKDPINGREQSGQEGSGQRGSARFDPITGRLSVTLHPPGQNGDETNVPKGRKDKNQAEEDAGGSEASVSSSRHTRRSFLRKNVEDPDVPSMQEIWKGMKDMMTQLAVLSEKVEPSMMKMITL